MARRIPDNGHTTTPFISLDRITVRVRDRHILKDTTWRIYPGQQWAVIGPNGAGKSTLVRALAGLAPIVQGRSVRGGKMAGTIPVGYVSFEGHRRIIAAEENQDHARHFSGRIDDLATARQMLDMETHGDVAAHWEDQLSVTHLLDRPLRHLSTGEIRKVLLYRAISENPDLLVLDEPFDGLDADSRRQLKQVVAELIQTGQQLVLVTHRWQDLPTGITHVLKVVDGRVDWQGPMGAFRPDDPALSPSDTNPIPLPAKPETPTSPGSTDEPLVAMRRVQVAYGSVQVLEDVNWEVHHGENWMVVGPNGAGKSTMLNLITADNPQAYANDIRLFGRQRGSGESIWEIKQRIGHVSAATQINYRAAIPAASVVVSGFFDSVGLFRQASSAQRLAADTWMDHLGIQHLGPRPFDQLSHGEQRMVLLTRAMVKSPDLLIMDEPCQGLDPANRMRLLDLIERIGSRTPTVVIYVTHYPEETLPCITHIFEFKKNVDHRPVRPDQCHPPLLEKGNRHLPVAGGLGGNQWIPLPPRR